MDLALLVSNHMGDGQELGIVENFEGKSGSGCGSSVGLFQPDGNLFHISIAAKLVQHHGVALDSVHILIFRNDLVEPAGMYHHGTGGSVREPALVQDRFRFAGSGEVPFSVAPEFYPGVVVITVGPEGRVNLTGRDAGASQSADGESGFLSAAAVSTAVNVDRRDGTVIGRVIGGLLRAPVVDFYRCLCHGFSLDSVFQIFIENAPAVQDLLGVDPVIKDIVEENLLGHFFHIGAVLPEENAVLGIIQERRNAIVSHIAQRHGGVKEFQCQSHLRAVSFDLFFRFFYSRNFRCSFCKLSLNTAFTFL